MNDDLQTALQLITSQLGITMDQLAGEGGSTRQVPTFSEYIANLKTALPATTTKNYAPYWRIVDEAWGSRLLTAPTTTEIQRLAQEHRKRAVVRSNSRGGRAAAEHVISSLRCIYKHAEFDGLISPIRNPARNAEKPRRLPSSRHALTRDQVVAIGQVASTTGNDTELDALITRIHIEAACRRAGALDLEIDDLIEEQSLIRLGEKGETVRLQPISPLLMVKLLEHVDSRGGPEATTRVLRYRNGRPITKRRYDYLTGRIRQHLPWAQRLQVSIHWVRHTTITYVEREFGEAVARAYAGHTELGNTGSTPIYTKASLVEVAEALAALTGQPHPLAREIHHPLAPWGADGCSL